jgi:putative endonuclease
MFEKVRVVARRLRGEPVPTGEAGEKAAEKHLVQTKGLKVLARNWRHGRDELDLVCRDGDLLVFVEVKTRRSGAKVPGYFAVNQRKKKALMRAIRAYRARLSPKPKAIRFDVVEVEWGGKAPGTIRHFENVPIFSKGFARS